MRTQVSMRFVFLPALWLTIALTGCGTGPSCTFIAIKIAPQTATIDHNAAPPANTLQFSTVTGAPPPCAIPQTNVRNATWSVSDSFNVSISNVHDRTFGTATCLGATAGPATVTATAPSGDGMVRATATLTCQ